MAWGHPIPPQGISQYQLLPTGYLRWGERAWEDVIFLEVLTLEQEKKMRMNHPALHGYQLETHYRTLFQWDSNGNNHHSLQALRSTTTPLEIVKESESWKGTSHNTPWLPWCSSASCFFSSPSQPAKDLSIIFPNGAEHCSSSGSLASTTIETPLYTCSFLTRIWTTPEQGMSLSPSTLFPVKCVIYSSGRNFNEVTNRELWWNWEKYPPVDIIGVCAIFRLTVKIFRLMSGIKFNSK